MLNLNNLYNIVFDKTNRGGTMKNNNLYADLKNLSTEEILDCYLKAFEKLDEEDQEKIANCHAVLIGIKNMGVFSAWELLSKLGIFLTKIRNFV